MIKKIFKALFKNKNKIVESKYSLGKRNDKGYCDLYVNGERTNVRMLVFTPEQVKKLQKIGEDIYTKRIKINDK